MEHFVDGEAKDIAVDGGDAVDFVIFDDAAQCCVDFLAVLECSADEGIGEEPGGSFFGGGGW